VTKTILLIDDEQVFLEALVDALEFEGFRVLKATNGQEALEILRSDYVDVVTIDIMLDAGESLNDKIDSHRTGLFLCKEIRSKYPQIKAFCMSVVSDADTIRTINSLGIRFLHKGEIPLRVVLDYLRSALTGIAYSTDNPRRK
jgi:DNA-binding NarL/FixJ family response regulator